MRIKQNIYYYMKMASQPDMDILVLYNGISLFCFVWEWELTNRKKKCGARWEKNANNRDEL